MKKNKSLKTVETKLSLRDTREKQPLNLIDKTFKTKNVMFRVTASDAECLNKLINDINDGINGKLNKSQILKRLIKIASKSKELKDEVRNY